ncbi:MAG: hypothetical protein ACLSGA_10805 [Ruminococcus sp.]
MMVGRPVRQGDSQNRGPRQVMETDVDSVGAVTTETIEMETEMAADLARRPQGGRDVSRKRRR